MPQDTCSIKQGQLYVVSVESYLASDHGCTHVWLYLPGSQSKVSFHFPSSDLVCAWHMGRRRDWWLPAASIVNRNLISRFIKQHSSLWALLSLIFKWKCWKDNFYPLILIHFNLVSYFATLQTYSTSPPIAVIKMSAYSDQATLKIFPEKRWGNFLSINFIISYG